MYLSKAVGLQVFCYSYKNMFLFRYYCRSFNVKYDGFFFAYVKKKTLVVMDTHWEEVICLYSMKYCYIFFKVQLLQRKMFKTLCRCGLKSALFDSENQGETNDSEIVSTLFTIIFLRIFLRVYKNLLQYFTVQTTIRLS